MLLIDKMEKLRDLLKSSGKDFWSQKIEDQIINIENSGVNDNIKTTVISWFGGMGSLNDLYICSENGFDLRGKDMNQMNKDFHDLKSEIYTICSQL